nr:AAA family ATPase [Planotetraspora phitsanulokensis]
MELEPFSVITGPNGSGKSNLVDALAFLGEVYRFGFEFAVGRAGGMDAISFRDKRRTTIGVKYTAKALLKLSEIRNIGYARKKLQEEYGEVDLELEHHFVLKAAPSATGLDYIVEAESLELSAYLLGEWILLLHVKAGSAGSSIEVTASYLSHERQDVSDVAVAALGNITKYLNSISEDSAGLGQSLFEIFRLAPVVREYQIRMGLIRAYRLSPDSSRQPAVLTPNATLDSHGGNLPAVVARISRQQPSVWQSILAGMRQLLPDLVTITTEPSAERGLILQFNETNRGRPWSSHEVSDGTIQALALLVLLHDSRPPLILIEEPENAVHPWVLRRFLETCRSLLNKQIVLTTHSPILLKLVRPEEVFLMWRTQGRSKLRPLLTTSPEVRGLYYEKGFDVFELYDSGLIAQAIPGADEGSV